MARNRRDTVAMLSCDGFDRGGIGTWAAYLFEAFVQLPAAPKLLMLDTRAPSGGPLANIIAFARALVRLIFLCLTRRVAIVHLNVAERGSTVRKFIASEIAGLFGIPTVVHLHSGNYVEFYRALPGWARPAVRRLFHRAAKVIVLGRIWEDVVVRELGVPQPKVMVLFNGVSRPAPSARAIDRADASCHIVMLARLRSTKGVDELMEALTGDRLRPLAWRATLAGSGAEPYQRQAAAAGMADRIVFPGWLDAAGASRLLSEADILVLPSHFECMPVSVLEAMAHGVAVIATPVGAVPEIITDGETGLLVPVRDPSALAVALARLIGDRQLRDRLARGGQAVFERDLDVRQSAQRLARLYDAIQGRGSVELGGPYAVG